jgi:RNA polymerase sigma factor (sigma-70 family)
MQDQGGRLLTSADPPALAEAGVAMSPIEALGVEITREFPRLRVVVQVLVWKLGLADRRQDVPDLADEVLSETVAQAIKLVDRWDQARGTRPWMATIAGYIIMQRRRKLGQERARFPRMAATVERATDPADDLVDPATVGADRLFELLDVVGEPERTLLRRAYVDHEPQAALARQLGITDGTLRVRLTRAKQKYARAFNAADLGGRS